MALCYFSPAGDQINIRTSLTCTCEDIVGLSCIFPLPLNIFGIFLKIQTHGLGDETLMNMSTFYSKVKANKFLTLMFVERRQKIKPQRLYKHKAKRQRTMQHLKSHDFKVPWLAILLKKQLCWQVLCALVLPLVRQYSFFSLSSRLRNGPTYPEGQKNRLE